jgi:hypothetical protein
MYSFPMHNVVLVLSFIILVLVGSGKMGRVSCILSKDLLECASMIELQNRRDLDILLPPTFLNSILLHNNHISIF